PGDSSAGNSRERRLRISRKGRQIYGRDRRIPWSYEGSRMQPARTTTIHVEGHVASTVRCGGRLTANFQRHDEVGAAIAVYHRGELVVDLAAGRRDRSSEGPEKNLSVAVPSKRLDPRSRKARQDDRRECFMRKKSYTNPEPTTQAAWTPAAQPETQI